MKKPAVDSVKLLEDAAILASEAAKPSSDPAYWAKSSCNRCYGRGIVGKMSSLLKSNTIVQQLLCSCSRSRFMKWRDAWVKNYLVERQNVSATVVDNVE